MEPIGRSRIVGPYKLYERPGDAAPFFVGPAEGPEPGHFTPSFYACVGVHNPVLMSKTSSETGTGFTTAFEDLTVPLSVMLLHTPDRGQYYDLDRYLAEVDDIMTKASIDLFDWYWVRTNSCFRRVLEGRYNHRYTVNVTVSEAAAALFKADDLRRPVSITDLDGVCQKEDIIECWDHYDMLGDLALDRDPMNFLRLYYEAWYLDTIVINGTLIMAFNTHVMPTKITVRTKAEADAEAKAKANANAESEVRPGTDLIATRH